MNLIRTASALALGFALSLSATSAHAIAVMNPTPAQVTKVEARVTKTIQKSAFYKANPGTISLAYKPGIPTIGMDRTEVRPTLTATIEGQAGAYGMADNNQRTWTINVGKTATAKADGPWQRLLTGVAK